MNDKLDTLKKPDPIQSNKWGDMNILELQDQRLLLSDRLNTMASIIDGFSPPSYNMIVNSLSLAISDLDYLIQQKQRAEHDRHK